MSVIVVFLRPLGLRLFDIPNDYSKGLAEIFKAEWEKKSGAGTVVAFESHGTKDQDFSAQLTKIIAAKPDFIFVPKSDRSHVVL